MGANILRISVILLAVSVISSKSEGNGTKPVIFLTSPPTAATTTIDSRNSESRVNEKVVSEGQSSNGQKQAVSSQGYQLEVIEDNTEEAQERSGSNNYRPQLSGLYTQAVVDQTSSLLDQFLQQSPDYEENSAKEDVKGDFFNSKGKISYGDLQPKADISKVRDIFVGKEVSGGKSHLPNSRAGVPYPSSSLLESKYKLEHESPLKYVNSPILLKQANLPLVEPTPVDSPLTHPHHGLLDIEVTGHTAGYGHGFHHHQQKLKAKPLKPSVVYRDPSDHFDHHDKIRTLDKDHIGSIEKDSRHPYGPHVISKGHEFHGHGKKVIFEPTYYDQNKIPECAHKNKYIYNLTFCLDDPHYPVETITWAIKEADHYAKKLLSDVTYQSADNLVTGLTRAEEEGYTYKHYFGATHAQNVHLDKYKPPYQGYTYSTDYFKKGGYICPSDIYYARPKRAMNTFGKWKVIVNLDHVPDHGYDKYGHQEGHHGRHLHEGGHLYGKGHEGGNYGKGHEEGHYGKGHDEGHYGKGHEEGHYGKGHDEGHYGKGHEEGHYGKGHEGGHYGKSHEEGHYGKGHEQGIFGKHNEHHDGQNYGKGHGHHEQGPYDKHHEHDDGHYGKGPIIELGHQQQHHGHNEGHQYLGHNVGHQLNTHNEGHGLHGYQQGLDHHSIKKREYKESKKSYTQTLRLEKCIYSNAPCSYVDSHFHSRCIQKHNFVRLVAWTKEEGIHVDTFKMPIACSCHVRQPIHFYHESGHHKHGHVSPITGYHGHHGSHPHEALKKPY